MLGAAPSSLEASCLQEAPVSAQDAMSPGVRGGSLLLGAARIRVDTHLSRILQSSFHRR